MLNPTAVISIAITVLNQRINAVVTKPRTGQHAPNILHILHVNGCVKSSKAAKKKVELINIAIP